MSIRLVFAVNDGRAQPVLKTANTPRKCRLRNVSARRRAGHIAFFEQRQNVVQPLHIHPETSFAQTFCMGSHRKKHCFSNSPQATVPVDSPGGNQSLASADQVIDEQRADHADMTASHCKELSIALAQFPRVSLGHFPTPLEPMDRLSEILGGPRLWVKRDDCTGLSSGGNKTRKLEYLMADAVTERGGYDRHPRCDPIKPRPPDCGGGRQAGHGVPHSAGGPDRVERPQLHHERQRLAGPICMARPFPKRPRWIRHERRKWKVLADELRTERQSAVRDPGRRLEPDRRAGLRELRPRAC